MQQFIVVLAGASDDVGSFGDGRLGDDNLAPKSVDWVSADIMRVRAI